MGVYRAAGVVENKGGEGMKKLAISSVVILAILLVSVSCSAPGPPGAANDDIVYPPGGFTYRANVHQQGQPDWPAVQQTEVTIETLSGTVDIKYRDYIETKAGETRNNIIFLNGRNALELLNPLQVYYRAVDLPDGIAIERNGQMYGGIGGQDKKSSRVALLIHIALQVKPGEYPFAIHLDYEGKELGSIPCTIVVLE